MTAYSSERIAVDGDALRHSAARLRAIIADFDDGGAVATAAADAVGHRALAATVRDFGSNWSVHRGRLVATLTDLADACEAVADTFADLERALARTVAGAGGRG